MRITLECLVACCLLIPASCTESVPGSKAAPERSDVEQHEDVVPAMRLTAGDGTGLELVNLEVRGAVQGPLAFTELHMTFENPEPRILAGQFSIDLPPAAALSRFAMKIDGTWQEGEVVERRAARQIYDRYLHDNVDPALLEKQAGNRFSAKVFPIPAHGRKELVLSYSQVLDGPRSTYRVPLRGLPRLENYQATVFVDEPGAARRVVRESEAGVVPRKDLLVPTGYTPASVAVRGDDGVAARIVVEGSARQKPLGPLTLAFDTSASRALGYTDRVRRLRDLVKALAVRNPDLPLEILAFDQQTEEVFTGSAEDFGQQEVEQLLARGAQGASDLEALLRGLARRAPSHLVLVTDGVPTVGDTELDRLRVALDALGAAGLQRLDAVLDDTSGSDAVLKGLVQGQLENDGVITRNDRPADQQVRRLARDVLDPVSVASPGASLVWPQRVEGLQPGDAIMVYVEGAPKGDLAVSLRGGLEQDVELESTAVPGPLVSRALAAARIEAMTAEYSAAEDPTEKDLLKAEIVEFSRTHRVISDFTAMLVLESDQDYERFEIDRDATVDILIIGDKGPKRLPHRRLGQVERGKAAPTDVSARQAGILGMMAEESGHFLASPDGAAFAVGNDDEDVWGGLTGTEIGEAYGVGGLGLVGTGRGGGGVATGSLGLIGTGKRSIGFGRRTSPNRVRIRSVLAKHGLDTSITRRIIRAHINEIRGCYAQGLERNPALQGRVGLELKVNRFGKVVSSRLGRSTLANQRVERCVERRGVDWKFPKPLKGATAEVSVQFRLDPLDRPVRGRPFQARPSTPVAYREPESLAEVDAALAQPYEGPMLEVMAAIEAGEFANAVARAARWQRSSPHDVMALLALGGAYEAMGKRGEARRVYGSLIDTFPSDAPMLRHAAARLSALGGEASVELALDAARQAHEERPHHPSSHRALAWALVANDKHKEAFDVLVAALDRRFDSRYQQAGRILRDDAEVVAAQWLRSDPDHAKEIARHVEDEDIDVARDAVTHFVLSWETDANDVDLHIYDGDGQHAYYQQRALPSGGQLYADVTNGYGPESFTIEDEPTQFPYRIDVGYFRRGAMGYGLGDLQIIRFTPDAGVTIQTLPFGLMTEKGRARLAKLEE